MTGTLQQLLPVFVGIAAGQLARRLKLVDRQDGETAFKLVFYQS